MEGLAGSVRPLLREIRDAERGRAAPGLGGGCAEQHGCGKLFSLSSFNSCPRRGSEGAPEAVEAEPLEQGCSLALGWRAAAHSQERLASASVGKTCPCCAG